ncbi:MAG TPA: HAMP domain-containing sensor histidine kinase [Phycisphaerae bacterium]|nr:HAMP domain-containing sensor histidine kinase [Phycisphaerae bacterium]
MPLLADASFPPDSPAHALLVVLLATLAIALLTGTAAIVAFNGFRSQRRRTEELARDLSRVNASVRRRLNFLNAISHDLRTPLNGITLQTHIIDQALAQKDFPLLERCAADIRESSALAAEILDALLQYAHTDIEHNAVATFPLREMLQQVADPFRAAAEEKKIALTLSVPDNLTLTTDREKFQRILANLLDNAVKFTTHGTITIRVAAETPEALLLEVADTGAGIAPDHLEHLFQEFYQVNNPSRDARLGLGLGLVVARRLAGQLGGTLRATSELGDGSTFQLRLPRRCPPRPAAAPAPPPNPPEQRAEPAPPGDAPLAYSSVPDKISFATRK